ncbi:hypothetical protein KABACHOK_05100 [Brevundimonas phage vB_BpoS-Kabachok]|uniref:Gene 1 ring forming protein domain-containing protein n=1 Tax=Brevundimonas phage vB_BpoS-Kabachok TaxID=2948600 RepID=A0A9E7MQ84_9CAUD|nr:hypothetical protein KABACHOK_05100 [Brevundimonas phage vB_BpoS-Kabachok]
MMSTEYNPDLALEALRAAIATRHELADKHDVVEAARLYYAFLTAPKRTET